jgi:hypothetical protein
MNEVIDFRERTQTKFETDEEQVIQVMKGLNEAKITKVLAVIEDSDGDLRLFNANNSPEQLLWLAKMIEIHALKKAGYNT